jgi:uncharacterized membrane protein
MSQITKAIDITLPPQQVFDYIADFRNSLSYMPNFTKFEANGRVARGLGATVEAEGHFLGVNIKTTLEIIEFDEPSRLVSRSTQGVKSLSIWELKPLPTGGTEVTFTSDYSLPGRMLGWMLDRLLIEKDVEKTVIQTLVNLKKVMEGKPNLRIASPSW